MKFWLFWLIFDDFESFSFLKLISEFYEMIAKMIVEKHFENPEGFKPLKMIVHFSGRVLYVNTDRPKILRFFVTISTDPRKFGEIL